MVEASQYTEVVANGDPMASVELSTSDVTPFIDDHLQAAFSTTCECYLVYEGKIVAPQSGCYLTVDGPCVNRDHKQAWVLERSVETVLQKWGIVLENGAHRVASFVTTRSDQRVVLHLIQGNVLHFETQQAFDSLRYVHISEVIGHARYVAPMRHLISYTAAKVSMLRCLKIYHELDLVREDSEWSEASISLLVPRF
jgi:hypothetical protein